MSNSVFENKNYTIVAGPFAATVRSNGSDFEEGYSVINKVTGIVEFRVPQMAEAIAAAEQLDMAMETRPWEWARKKTEPAEVNPDGSPKEVH